MKAKIIKTGEIVEVYHEPQHGQQTVIYKEAIFVNGRMFTENELDFMFDEETHWQDVRERAAIAAMQSLIYKSQDYQLYAQPKAVDAVAYADALVEQLKKK